MTSNNANGHPLARISRADLDSLIAALEVSFVKLSECLVSQGWRLTLPATDAPAIHYNIAGMGRMIIGDQPPIALEPHTLVIVPPGRHFCLEVPADRQLSRPLNTLEGHLKTFASGAVRRFVAGDDAAPLIMICGYFRASYGASIDLFGALNSEVVERFAATDHLDQKLKSALAELVAQEVGMGAMTASLLKQVMITLLRRSMSSTNLWAGQLSVLSDPQIARALAEMVTKPGAAHSVLSLSQAAGLSRSAFMARFTAVLGKPPMMALRDLRMRQAAILLNANSLSVDQIAHTVGYDSRSGFLRAFRKVQGSYPSDYRAAQQPVTA
jgi:AraC family transcriptional activator of mtrCDE